MSKSNARALILRAIRAFRDRHHCGPTVRHLCSAVGMSSTSSVHYHLHRLREAGLVDWEKGLCGSLHLTRLGQARTDRYPTE